MYSVGERLIYGQTGVCEIIDICEKTFIKNQKNLYYVLKPLNMENNLIYAPVENNKVFMRRLITLEQAEKLICDIPQIMDKICDTAELTKEYYTEKINNHTLEQLVELTAIIYAKKLNVEKMKKRLNIIDEKYMKIGENLLFGELSTVLDIPLSEVQGYIEQKIASTK